MKDCVRQYFGQLNQPIEGIVPYMYLDVKGLVTVGMGNRVDPVGEAQQLPFRFKSKPGIKNPGQMASQAQIGTEWTNVKNSGLAQAGHTACASITNLELDASAIDRLISQRLLGIEQVLKRRFGEYDSWPADAQLGILSMAWAMGPGFYNTFWSQFNAACDQQDFVTAAFRCHISEARNPGVKPRNKADFILFGNAAAVVANENRKIYVRNVLYFPRQLVIPTGVDTITQRTESLA